MEGFLYAEVECARGHRCTCSELGFLPPQSSGLLKQVFNNHRRTDLPVAVCLALSPEASPAVILRDREPCGSVGPILISSLWEMTRIQGNW